MSDHDNQLVGLPTIAMGLQSVYLSPSNVALLMAVADLAGQLSVCLAQTFSVDKSVALCSLEQELSGLLVDAQPLLAAYDALFDADARLIAAAVQNCGDRPVCHLGIPK